jgi:CRISPR-associated protein Cmr4
MYTDARVMTLYAETPLHPGTGQSTGIIDLPVQRERHTGHPIIQASSLKGRLRSFAGEHKSGSVTEAKIAAVFGPEEGDLYGGALSVSDARLLIFPVRALTGVFVWLTSPLILYRLKRDLAAAGYSGDFSVHEPPTEKAVWNDALGVKGDLVLEELIFSRAEGECADVANFLADRFLPQAPTLTFFKQRLKSHLVIVSNDDFRYLVEQATTVTARIVLSDEKTSDNLWYEETLPPDSLLYAFLMGLKPRDGGKSGLETANQVLSFVARDLKPEHLQIGGNETLGQGWCRIHFPDLPMVVGAA